MLHHWSQTSPKLERLRQALEAGDVATLNVFWQEVGRQGTPLIEPIEGDPEHSLVPFSGGRQTKRKPLP